MRFDDGCAVYQAREELQEVGDRASKAEAAIDREMRRCTTLEAKVTTPLLHIAQFKLNARLQHKII